jgi:hypothetical protein
VIISLTNVTEKIAPVMSALSSGGNHPANYKGCTVYKELQQKTFPSLRPKQYTPPAPIHRTLQTQPGVTYAQITKNLPPATFPTDQAHLPPQPTPQPKDMQDLKDMFTRLSERMDTLLNLLTTVITKLK